MSLPWLEAVDGRCSVKKIFLEIAQKSQENTCAKVSFLIKLQLPPPPIREQPRRCPSWMGLKMVKCRYIVNLIKL